VHKGQKELSVIWIKKINPRAVWAIIFKFLLHHISIFTAELCAIFTAVFAVRNGRRESYSYVLIHALPFVALKMIQIIFPLLGGNLFFTLLYSLVHSGDQ
jgi:hypothetical protein